MTTAGDFHDPNVLQATFIKFLHVVGGIYVCEFVTSLWFEWQVAMKKRTYRWSIWVYSGCRVSALFAIFTAFIGYSLTIPINCGVWLALILVFKYLSFVFASALIILRIVAIWERNYLVSAVVFITLLADIIFYIRDIILSEAIWSTEEAMCIVTKTDRNVTAVITLSKDLVLLTLMFIGLRRHRDVHMRGLWRFLCFQGILWLVIIAVTEVPEIVFIFTNLNVYFELMCEISELVVMAVGASRLYRALADFGITTNFEWENERFWSFCSLPGVATNNLRTTGTIRFNTLSEGHSRTNSPSPSRLRTQHQHFQDSEPIHPRSDSQTSSQVDHSSPLPAHSTAYAYMMDWPLPPAPGLVPPPSRS
ncbi:hypothetical protein EDB85DRAFT_2150298 [Lactarius pseudohatsudake]|nr:hypothetical protein EDB85DRAFT_2150298 [Lactarius pseudohatsudake]